jgi:hypothetical protein
MLADLLGEIDLPLAAEFWGRGACFLRNATPVDSNAQATSCSAFRRLFGIVDD